MLIKAGYVACIIGMFTGATASAECAWVLWKHVIPVSVSKTSAANPYKDSWELLAAYTTNDQCREAQQRVWKVSVESSEPCRTPGGCANRP